ncbi:MAG: NUDIX domain-containing protein [Pseudomonadota bacterium]
MVTVSVFGPMASIGVVQAILGHDITPIPCTLHDHAFAGGDCVVPALSAASGNTLDGLWLELTDTQFATFQFVSDVLGLSAKTVSVTVDGTLRDTTTVETSTTGSEPWMDAENLGWAAILSLAIEEILSYRKDLSASDVADRLGPILSRAASKATAMAATPKPSESGHTNKDITIHEHRRPYSLFFTVEEVVFSHTKFDGSQSDPLLRAVFLAADAVTVLPYDPVRDRVLLVEQVRASPMVRGDQSPWILEPIAGRIEPGDTPETTARKEAEEEAGLTLQDLHFIGDYYPSTGCFTEYLYSYVATADLPDSAAGLGGVLAEGEDIRAHIISRGDLMRRIDNNEIPDGPLILTAYWLERNLHRLRG